MSIRLVPFKEQDKLQDGEFKVYVSGQNKEFYVKLEEYGISGKGSPFRPLAEQDKLPEGLIKVSKEKDCYVSIDEIPEISEGGCFIATAVYGSPNAPQVQTLREFRNDVLMRSSLGRVLVDFYYSGAGNMVAELIKNHLPSVIPGYQKRTR